MKPKIKRIARRPGIQLLSAQTLLSNRVARSCTVGGTHLVLGSVRGRGLECTSADSRGLDEALTIVLKVTKRYNSRLAGQTFDF
jgi:hypothetical protein